MNQRMGSSSSRKLPIEPNTTHVFQSVIARKSTNQVVVLSSFKSTDEEQDGSYSYQAYISLVDLDYVSADEGTDRMVHVHAVTHERATEKGHGIETTQKLHF